MKHDLRCPPLSAVQSGWKVGWASFVMARRSLIIFFITIVLVNVRAQGAPGFQLLQAPGGLAGTQIGNSYFITFGSMNALGLGTPATGLTVAASGTGALYFTPFQVQFTGLNGVGRRASFTAFVSTNFNHPAAQVLQNCPTTASCSTSGGYSAMSTVQAAPSTIIANTGDATVTAGIGIFLPDNDGAAAFSGVDNVAVVTYVMRDINNNQVLQTATVSFNAAPNNTVQTAVQLTLATAAGGLTVTPAADYSMNFGNVNGLGFGPGAGLTTVAAAGGVIYSTPYLLQPIFTDFTSTTATIKAFVSTNFAHPAILKMNDAAASAGPYTLIGTSAGTATQITSTAGDRSTITRFLGLFVSNVNGAAAFTGNDAATLTFTLTVP